MSTESGVEIKKVADIDELFKKIKWKWYEYPELFWRRCIQAPWEDFWMYSKRFIQRGKRGFGDYDVWCMHGYLTTVIYDMLIHLKQYKHGYPATLDDMGKYEYDEARWDKVLDEMIEGFALLKRCDSGEDDEIQYAGPYMTDKQRLKIELAMQEKYPKFRYTTREEERKIERAFDLLKDNWFGLWD